MRAVVVFALLLLLPTAASWNVLFVNVFATGSHQTVSGYLANLLVDNGHTVTYISMNNPRYLHKAVDVKQLPHSETVMKGLKGNDNETLSWRQKLGKVDTFLTSCARFYDEPNVREILKTEPKFDLFLTFGVFFDPCALGMAHYLGIKNTIIHVSAPVLFPIQIPMLGLPIYSSSVNINNILIQDHEGLKTSLGARALNLLKRNIFLLLNIAAVNWYIEPVLYKNFPAYPGYKETYKSVKMMIMNTHPHPLIDGPTPFGPGVLTVAGTLCKDYNPEEFTSDLKDFMDSATEGLIYLSFGSVQEDASPEEQSKWLETFSKLPYKVILKQSKPVENLPPNVKVYSWLPQMSVLQHPNMRLFITHGGYASKIEASCAGVPLLVVPKFAPDQYYTADRIATLGMGEKIDNIDEISSEEIYSKIIRIAGQEDQATTYKMKMKTVKRHLLQTRVTDEQILGYLDSVIGGNSFLPGYQPWYEYFYLDIFIAPVVTVLMLRYIFRKFTKSG